MLKEQTNLEVFELQEKNGSLPNSSINPNVDIDKTRLRIETAPENNFQSTITGKQSLHSRSEATNHFSGRKLQYLQDQSALKKRFHPLLHPTAGRSTTVTSKQKEQDELEKKNRKRVTEEKKKEAERL
ncbi:hypothetical protein ILUMI_02560 [Ignelater luminosus]|uniref:Uncharacterized protein n=1 Tax=Ignelater luminosus TaxID=2038154 RepID=A0A8K0GN26_IGNLU|nr:hypothetical protein ILUMI_02560 [Ignelater luminosus]